MIFNTNNENTYIKAKLCEWALYYCSAFTVIQNYLKIVFPHLHLREQMSGLIRSQAWLSVFQTKRHNFSESESVIRKQIPFVDLHTISYRELLESYQDMNVNVVYCL